MPSPTDHSCRVFLELGDFLLYSTLSTCGLSIVIILLIALCYCFSVNYRVGMYVENHYLHALFRGLAEPIRRAV